MEEEVCACECFPFLFFFLLVCWLFLFRLTSVALQYGTGSVLGIVPMSLQSIIQIIYLNDRNKRT